MDGANFLIRRLRLGSGLILLAYVTGHLLNSALGLFSLGVLEEGRLIFLSVWRGPAGTLLLYGALTLHLGIALLSLYRRPSLRLNRREIVQLSLGLATPPLLILHALGTRGADEWFDVNDTYHFVLASLWGGDPWVGLRQLLIVVAAWVHACIGVHIWLRRHSWYRSYQPALLGVALVVPMLALAGFSQSSRDVLRLMQDPGWIDYMDTTGQSVTPAQGAFLYRYEAWFLWSYGAILVMILLARQIRAFLIRHRTVTIRYLDGHRVTITPGMSILEASQKAGIPHAAVCGGHGRCSTCRIRVVVNSGALPDPSPGEAAVLERVNLPPGIRLACQLRPAHSLTVEPLLPATVKTTPVPDYDGVVTHGSEEEIAILFVDLRDFTSLASKELPYDVVFVLNRYFAAMGEAIAGAGGHIDKFIGDGVMALFGIGEPVRDGCRRALAAALAIGQNMARLNEALAAEQKEPLKIGVGAHVGRVILGEMGYAKARALTAVGDAVNVASRLESITKELQCEGVFSQAVIDYAAIDWPRDQQDRRQVTIRGQEDAIDILRVAKLTDLPAIATPVRKRWRRLETASAKGR